MLNLNIPCHEFSYKENKIYVFYPQKVYTGQVEFCLLVLALMFFSLSLSLVFFLPMVFVEFLMFCRNINVEYSIKRNGILVMGRGRMVPPHQWTMINTSQATCKSLKAFLCSGDQRWLVQQCLSYCMCLKMFTRTSLQVQ